MTQMLADVLALETGEYAETTGSVCLGNDFLAVISCTLVIVY